ncbi:MAG: hypothetical protein LCH80_01605 [Proteobacteria bacterium]|nr:hypothetical protein [Pseudomonadota bacterium]
MARRSKLAVTGLLAVLAAASIMFLLHNFEPFASITGQAGSTGTFPMAAMSGGMGWMMLLGPLAMVLFLGGAATLIALLVTFVVRSADRPG